MPFLTSSVDLSGVSMPAAMEGMKEGYKHFGFDDPTSYVIPENDAAWFYLSNHANTLLAGVDTQEARDLMKENMGATVQQAFRMYWYLFQICVKEGRYQKNWASFRKEHKSKFPAGLIEFWNKSIGDDWSTIRARLHTKPPADTTLGEFVDFMCLAYNEGKWSASYGGKAWGNIASTLAKFVHGKYNIEMLLDTAWTLVHNTGPIFNKGFLYRSSSKVLELILDVQRAGGMPELVKSKFDEVNSHYLSNMEIDKMLSYWKKVEGITGTEAGTQVNWVKVNEWGEGKWNYAPFIENMNQGESPTVELYPGVTVMKAARSLA